MNRLIRAALTCGLIACLSVAIPLTVSAADEPAPTYLQQAQSAVAQVLAKGSEITK